jgi:hypothetical protein
VTHSIGLNDVCDALQLNSGPLSAIRGATPPTRNNLSHDNMVRDAAIAEKLFWAMYEHFGEAVAAVCQRQSRQAVCAQIQAHHPLGGLDDD